jgi:hypothetical protein
VAPSFAFCQQVTKNAGNHAEHFSLLWPAKDKIWNTARIPDFTEAGYKKGKEKIPVYPVSIQMSNYGAKGDGITDNTEALRKAIAACKSGGAILFPEGSFLIKDTIKITRANIVIRGSGKGNTTLLFDKGIEELYPLYATQYKTQTPWSWSGGMLLLEGNIEHTGIEDLCIQFPDSTWAGHNFHERGYNAVGFSKKAHDCWIRNVQFTGCDMAIWIEGSAHHITAENWVCSFGSQRAAQPINGHHGVGIYGGHNLLQHFEIKGKFHHDLSVESYSSIYNVFQNGKGKDLCIDHHNHRQSNNLFTQLDAGAGSRLYYSGGKDKPNGICFKETFWNITAISDMDYCDQYNNTSKQSADNVCVGIRTKRCSVLGDKNNNWFETIEPRTLYPANLYQAQMKWKYEQNK